MSCNKQEQVQTVPRADLFAFREAMCLMTASLASTRLTVTASPSASCNWRRLLCRSCSD